MEPVNSRVLEEDFDAANNGTHAITPASTRNGQAAHNPDGSPLEKPQTGASNASYEEWYPEGGMRAWLVVAGGWFALVSSMGTLNSLATFQAYWITHQLKDYSEDAVGWIVSMYTFLTFFCGVFIGPVFDKYGPRYLVIAGATCVVVSYVTLSFCKGMLSRLCLSVEALLLTMII